MPLTSLDLNDSVVGSAFQARTLLRRHCIRQQAPPKEDIFRRNKLHARLSGPTHHLLRDSFRLCAVSRI